MNHTRLSFFVHGILHPVTEHTIHTNDPKDIQAHLDMMAIGMGGVRSNKWFYPWHSIQRVQITPVPAPSQLTAQAKTQAPVSTPVSTDEASVMHDEGYPNHPADLAQVEDKPITLEVAEETELKAVERAMNWQEEESLEPTCNCPKGQPQPWHPIGAQGCILGDSPKFVYSEPTPEEEEEVEVITQSEDEEILNHIFGQPHND
jgi:hypothetical protein